MIVRERPTPWQLLFLWRLSILPRIVGQVASVAIVAVLAVVVDRSSTLPLPHLVHTWLHALHGWGVPPFTLLGVALSIFLGFRNSACYDRWWEARRQLGALVGEVRSFARVVTALPSAVSQAERRYLVLGAIAFYYALVAGLRGEPLPAEVARYAPDVALDNAPNPADRLVQWLGNRAGAMLASGQIKAPVYKLLEERLTAFSSVQVACERIRATPTPFIYTLLVHRTAYAFCVLLPFGLVGTLGYATPLLASLVAYAFFGLDALGDELEEPFSRSINALPLHGLARIVEISLLDALGEAELPPPLEPVGSVLL